MKRLAAWALGCALLVAPSIAFAGDPAADAAIEELAHEAYTAGDFAQAARLWERLLADEPDPPTAWLYYAADAWSRAGELDRATTALQTLLEHPDVDPALASTLERRLAALADASEQAERLATLEQIDEGDRAFRQRRYEAAIAHWEAAWQRGVDPSLPLRIADALEALGRHHEVLPMLEAVATWERWPLEQAYDARIEQARLAEAPQPTASATTTVDADAIVARESGQARSSRRVSVALGTTALAAATTAVASWSVALAASRRVDRQCAASGVCPATAEPDLATRRRAGLTGDVAAVVAGVATVAWVVQRVVRRRPDAGDVALQAGGITVRF